MLGNGTNRPSERFGIDSTTGVCAPPTKQTPGVRCQELQRLAAQLPTEFLKDTARET